MNWNALARKHADVVAGLVAWFGVGQFVGHRISPEWGGVTLAMSIAAGVIAYLLVQKVFPESRG